MGIQSWNDLGGFVWPIFHLVNNKHSILLGIVITYFTCSHSSFVEKSVNNIQKMWKEMKNIFVIRTAVLTYASIFPYVYCA